MDPASQGLQHIHGGRRWPAARWFIAGALVFLLLPLIDRQLPASWQCATSLRPIMVYAIIGLGLNIIAGFTGLLHLGSAAFMAVGAYTFAMLTCPIYPFQLGFAGGLICATLAGGMAGCMLAMPVMRLRGDYVAIVTLGFCEIVQDVLKNLDALTKGTQGLNPVAAPQLPGVTFGVDDTMSWYYLYAVILLGAVLLTRNLRRSRLGRSWVAVREDELAARAMGVATPWVKLSALACGSAMCSAGGALFASLNGTSIEPGFYDFQQSVIILCIVIVGGMGSITGVLLGALIMVGFNSIILSKLSDLINQCGLGGNAVWASPGNWKYFIYGMALLAMMRLRPEGLLPARDVQANLHPEAVRAPSQ